MPRPRSAEGPSVLRLRTTWGEIHVLARGGRVAACELPFRARAGDPLCVLGGTVSAASEADRDVLALARAFVEACMEGRAARRPPVALDGGTDFQRAVWRALCRIRRGGTASYGELARAVRRPKAARAVGAACGRNPLPLFVPCHRATGAGGHLGGFSAGLAWKKLLLAMEAGRA